jgi:predicted aldo/keto reductase-like oxidoreductase
MIYRRFGRTGLDVSVLSAGFMRSMHSWQPVPDTKIPPASQQNIEQIVRTALELGINHFETANAYGTCEQQLGLALRDIPRDSFFLQTKVQPSADPKTFTDNFYTSLDRLHMERVDLLAIHGINDYRSLWQACRENGCLAAARRLQKEGRVGAVGFSGHGSVDVITEAICFDGDRGFDYVNLHWYYIYQVNSRALDKAAKRDMGVFIISPTDKGGMLQEPPEKFQQLCHPWEPMVFNDVYCLNRPEIHTISIGASRPSDFTAHVEALAHLDAGDVVAKIDQQCSLAMTRAAGFPRPEALWTKLSSWDRTPGLINIPFILWLYNLARGWGLLAYSRGRYSKLGRDVKWVPGNNALGAGNHDLKSIAEHAGMQNDELVSLLEEAHGLLGQQQEKEHA